MQTRRIAKSRKGAALVEFGLCTIVFLSLLFGIMDWAWVFFMHQTLVSRTTAAARYAAAHHGSDNTTIKNIVMCGTPACSGGGMGFYTASNITINNGNSTPIPMSDTVDVTGLTGPLTRYFVKVTVSGYKINHFTPLVGSAFTGRPITAVQPMECQDPAGNCVYPPS